MNQATLKELLSYNPNTGLFTWLTSRGGRARAGRIAGASCGGRIYIKIYDKSYQSHRLAFLFMTGSFPEDQVDHIDGNPSNNRWSNLRACTRAQNGQNRLANKTNKSGLMGVSKHGNAWCAAIKADKKRFYLGRFENPEEAHQVYLSAKARIHTFQPIPRG